MLSAVHADDSDADRGLLGEGGVWVGSIDPLNCWGQRDGVGVGGGGEIRMRSDMVHLAFAQLNDLHNRNHALRLASKQSLINLSVDTIHALADRSVSVLCSTSSWLICSRRCRWKKYCSY